MVGRLADELEELQVKYDREKNDFEMSELATGAPVAPPQV